MAEPTKLATTPPEEAPAKTAEVLDAEVVKNEESNWLRFNSKVLDPEHPIRREILFFVLILLLAFSVIWGWAHGWQMYLAGLNPNLFHESLGTVLAILAGIWAYFKLYMTSDSFVMIQEAKIAAEKAAAEAKRKAEQERKDKAFIKIVVAFEKAKTFEERTRIMGDLLEVGTESPSLRQRTIDALLPMNQWMVENKIFLRTQNLISWRLKNNLFENSSRLQQNPETQDASIKVINIVESIIKKHIDEHIAGHNEEVLNLSQRCLPTLSISAKDIPPACIKLEEGHYWQSSFSESHLDKISFRGSDLYGASFWRATLNEVDFTETKLEQGKLRTNLQYVKNLQAEEFFATKEWDLCLLSRAQEEEFFGKEPNESDPNFVKWIASKVRRDKLYFGVDRI